MKIIKKESYRSYPSLINKSDDLVRVTITVKKIELKKLEKFCEEVHEGKSEYQLYHDKGYYERIKTMIYGEDYIQDVTGIDPKRYPPGSAESIAFNEGWELAEKEF